MALWKENPTPVPAGSSVPSSAMAPDRSPPERIINDPGLAVSPRRPTPKTAVEGGESVIAANLTIEGKIEGSGNVRMAGRFKGDVRIDGNFTMDSGAHLTGQVLAGIVVVGGELQGISSLAGKTRKEKSRAWPARNAGACLKYSPWPYLRHIPLQSRRSRRGWVCSQ
jgi:Polymer-forming cytoskeletal